MDLVSIDPVFNLYNLDWPIFTYPVQLPGAKFTLDGPATDSIVCPGCIVSGGVIDDSVLSPNVRVLENAVDQSVLLTTPGSGRKAVVAPRHPRQERCRPGRRADRGRPRGRPGRGFTVSDGGITIVGKGVIVTKA